MGDLSLSGQEKNVVDQRREYKKRKSLMFVSNEYRGGLEDLSYYILFCSGANPPWLKT